MANEKQVRRATKHFDVIIRPIITEKQWRLCKRKIKLQLKC